MTMNSPPDSALVGFADIRTQSIEDWQNFRVEGLQFLHLAENAYAKKKKAFTPEILYNLIAMAIEKLAMSALMHIGRLPYNHTMHDLADALEEWIPAAIAGMEESVRALDKHQEICDPYSFTLRTPSMDDIAHMLQLARILEQRLAPGVAQPL